MSSGKKKNAAKPAPVKAIQAAPSIAADELLKPTTETGADDGAGPNQAEARAAELSNRYANLVKWGLRERLPFTKETQADVEKFLAAAAAGDIDPSLVSPTTIDVRRLELFAQEWDEQHKSKAPLEVKPSTTKFDIEEATAPLKAASTVVAAADKVEQFAADAAKAGFQKLESAGSVIPGWVWVGVGVGMTAFVVSKLGDIAKTGQAVMEARRKS